MATKLSPFALGILATGLASACGTAPLGHSHPDSGATTFGIGVVGSGDSVDGGSAVESGGGDGNGEDGDSDGADDSTADASGGGDSAIEGSVADAAGSSDSSAADRNVPDGDTTDGGASDGAGDGASVTIGLGVHFKSLDWSIAGPHNYSGSVEFGDARSIEFVAGGIEAGSGYTLTLSGIDTDNDSCKGTSNLFSVQAGTTSDVTIVLTCTRVTDGAMAADVTTGSVRVEAGVANDP